MFIFNCEQICIHTGMFGVDSNWEGIKKNSFEENVNSLRENLTSLEQNNDPLNICTCEHTPLYGKGMLQVLLEVKTFICGESILDYPGGSQLITWPFKSQAPFLHIFAQRDARC